MKDRHFFQLGTEAEHQAPGGASVRGLAVEQPKAQSAPSYPHQNEQDLQHTIEDEMNYLRKGGVQFRAQTAHEHSHPTGLLPQIQAARELVN